MIDRRDFLAAAGRTVGSAGLALAAASAGTAGALVRSGRALAAASAPARAGGPGVGRRASLRGFGLQLYTVRAVLAEDFEAGLCRIGEMGYGEVEFAGYFGHSPDEVRRILARAGLDAPAAHVDFGLLGDAWPGTLGAAATVGHRWVVVPWIPAEERTGPDDYRRLADRFNRAGEAARREGLRFAHHNQAYEFAPAHGGEVPLEVLLEATDPDLVDFELDVFWALRGGADPLAYLRRFPDRFPLVHLKDMDEEGAMVDVGAGTIDFRRVLDAGRLSHAFVEHDEPADPMHSARAGLAHLRSLAR